MSGCLMGCRMQKAHGREMQWCQFILPALEKRFSRWKEADTARLCATILKKICTLRSQGIILGISIH